VKQWMQDLICLFQMVCKNVQQRALRLFHSCMCNEKIDSGFLCSIGCSTAESWTLNLFVSHG
jgi:hypothetical protein